MKKQIDLENLVLCQPLPASKTYHIFDRTNKDRSLCGKYGMIRLNQEAAEIVTGNENYKKGQDCKTCFIKAGLNVK